MRRHFIRLLAAALCVLLLAQAGAENARAADARYDGLTGWSREAMIFAVEHGILYGKEHGNLAPGDRTTRAEAAAIMVRLLGAPPGGSLSGFSDVKPGAWYVGELSAAVQLGILYGTGASSMEPDAPITREQTFAVLVRTFGLRPRDPEAGCQYTDWGAVSAYARPAVSALLELGCVSGYPDGTVRPKGDITREELAQILYEFLDAVCDDPAELPGSGRVLYRGAAEIPAGYVLDGDLILGCGWSGSRTLTDVSLTGTLLVRCLPGTALTLERLQAAGVLIASRTELISDAPLARLTVAAEETSVRSGGADAALYAGCALDGDWETVTVLGGNPRLAGTVSRRLTVDLAASGSTVTLDGSAESVVLQGREVTLQGGGYAGSVTVHGRNPSVTLACGALTEEIDYGIERLHVDLSGPELVTEDAPSYTLTAAFSGFEAGWGCTGDSRVCTVRWYRNGRLVHEDGSFVLQEGARAVWTDRVDFSREQAEILSCRVELLCGGERKESTWTVRVDGYRRDYRRALSTVETVKVEGTILRDTGLYTSSSLTGRIRTLRAGTVVTHFYYSGGGATQVIDADGTYGWVSWNDVLVSRKNYTSTSDYSRGTKEGFVDQKGYSSQTDYLVWVNLKTQKVNVFQGSRGSWKLIRECSAATGTNLTTTITGVFRIIYRRNVWDFGSYQVYHVSGFYGGYAFHSRTYAGTERRLLDGTMGRPASHGCVRMLDDDCAFIYGLPMGTTVVVY